MFLYISINCCVLTFTEIPCPLGIASFITSTCQLVTICTHFAVSFTTHTLSIWYILPICTNWKYNKPDLWYALKLMEKSISLCHLKSVIVLFFDSSKYQIYKNIRKTKSIWLRCQEYEIIICLLFKLFTKKTPR